jgi:hypothetical protein
VASICQQAGKNMLRIELTFFISFVLMLSTSVSQGQVLSHDSSATGWTKTQLDSMNALVRSDMAKERQPTRLDSLFLSPGELKNGWRMFRDTTIGIRFRYNMDIDAPMWGYLHDDDPGDATKWISYENKQLGLRFQYPPGLELRISKRSNTKTDDSDSSQVIMLGFQSSDSNWGFASLVAFYSTNASFAKVASDEGFEPSELDKTDHSALRIHNQIDSIQWTILGHQGMRGDASVLSGKVWKGLRGHTDIGVYYKGGGYAGLTDFTAAFLMRERVGGCAIVCRFYQGPTGAVEAPGSTNDAEDEPPLEIDEATFYRIVATIELMSN